MLMTVAGKSIITVRGGGDFNGSEKTYVPSGLAKKFQAWREGKGQKCCDGSSRWISTLVGNIRVTVSRVARVT